MNDHRTGDEAFREGGLQVEVEQSVDLPVETVYSLLSGAEGLACWMGSGAPEGLEEGVPFELDDGTSGETRVVEPDSHVCLTWQPDGWDEPSILEVRVVEAPDRSTALRFRHEGLPDAATREAMRAWWKRAIDALLEQADASGASDEARP